MRNQFPFLGLRTPVRRRLAREALRDLPAPTEPELASVARALWAEPEREFQHSGCDYLRTHIRVAGPAFIGVVHELVTTKPWWDTVDALAAHTAGPLVRLHPELAAVMDQWIVDDDIWLARTALLHQLAYKQMTDAPRLFDYCRLRAGDREFFIRKAIGWALRQYAAVAADAVAEFVAATPALSALSVREAMKGVARRG
jgi:3-methyladenine DNA glycosylase AlkD